LHFVDIIEKAMIKSSIKYQKGGIAMDFEGYCVKCRKKQKIKNGTIGKTAKGKPMAKGTCPECGTKVNRFLSQKDAG
jgi:hypothetical protein